MKPEIGGVLIPSRQIQKKVRQLGGRITEDY
jgi:hypothetical protein